MNAEEDQEDEETTASCRTTKTMLRGSPVVKDYIYKLVTATSELEARGNLIFTHALLRCNEEEAIIPAKIRIAELYDCLYTHSRSPHTFGRQRGWLPTM